MHASFILSHILAKSGKPFTDGQIMKNCIVKAVDVLCLDKLSFNAISLSANTVPCHMEDLCTNSECQLREACGDFPWLAFFDTVG